MAASARRQTSPVQLSIIIVNYNVRDFLHNALLSIEKARKGIRSEIIVVDNASEDGSVAMLRTQFPRVHVIASPTNLGFAKANNVGLQKAKGAYCLLINPDTVVQEDTLQVMLDFFELHPEVGLAGCKILNPDGTFQLACRRSFPAPWVAFTKIFGLSTLFPNSKWFGRYNLTYRPTDQTYEVDAVSGSFMMIRRSAFREVGGLDEDFFMYGEDLDWCYRFQHAGWKIFYVHTTSIIHYKGESTRRSSLNEVRTFYEAMRLFVKKHYGRSYLLLWSLKAGISFVGQAALVKSLLKPMKYSLIDFAVVVFSLLLAEYVWRGGVFLYPSYAYPIVFVVPPIIVIGALYGAGVYTARSMSVSRSFMAVFASYVVISALTALFKGYAFSRMIIGISGILCVILIPGWRLLLRAFGKARVAGRRSIVGKRTLIVGTDPSSHELLRKLRTYVAGDYEVVGFVDATMERIGEHLDGLPILGSFENISKVVWQHNINDVIFLPQSVSYVNILSMISKTREESVNFHLVPSTLEVIIGKGSIDSLNEVPLVQISYNIGQPMHRFTKRLFDFLLSSLLLVAVYPIFILSGRRKNPSRHPFIANVPSVVRGEMSFVGPPADIKEPSGQGLFVGKAGMTGLVQLQASRRPLTKEEIDQMNLYYARNQSVMLDAEILIKSWLNYRSKQRG
jgi:hypothetical protein